ncbi:MAG: M3 family metallopeptidase [Fluviicoccus sp.]|uniref:M3 family metallopeptidase n=1 Tax=Fluviicoccus sp. TaxID=2003552 RepID=UPI0027169698|nr:M3 family metallopeptidase [Fluviicoccus sp.]MDO8330535.1 M3 family metallopeptidase [Fluviicoccus sp.]
MNMLLSDTLELPAFRAITPELVTPAMDALLAENRTAIAALCAQNAPDWSSLPGQLEALDDRLSKAWSLVSHLNAVTNSPAWREAYNNNLPKISAYYTELGQNAELYNSYERLAQSPAFASFSDAQRQTVQNALRDFRLSGVALPEAQKQRFAAIEERLSSLGSKFADNLLDATQSWQRPLTEDELAGIPDSHRALLTQLAQQRGHEGWMATLDFPAYLAVMMHADTRNLRQAVYRAYVTRASDQGEKPEFDNSALMAEILELRHEQAQLLGYGSYAELSLVPKMAPSVEKVMEFLQELAERAKPAGRRDLEQLKSFAAEQLGLADLQPWDTTYVAEKLKQQQLNLSQEKLRAYFPAPTVIAGLFRIAETLFGVNITQADAEVWADGVTYYEIRENGQQIASFYLDPYARANKRGGAWMANARSRRRLADGTLQLPIAFLTCNFNPPVDGQPALLTHDEVTTLFHEFGHGLHHMLTEVEISAVGGIHGVSWDAVELPSQFMEHWCQESEGLAWMTKHIETGEPLPDDLLNSLLAAKNFQSGLMTLRQLEFSLFDMRIHSQSPLSATGIQTELDAVRREVNLLPPPSWNRFQHSFSHIFSGGYAAGYYSYKWAEVLSTDAFSRFEEEGIFNPETGRSFRREILAKGGSKPALELFTAFRGREPRIDALLRHTGLTV